MTDTPASIDDTLAELISDFELLGDTDEQIGHVLDMGRSLPPLPDHYKTEKNLIAGCMSKAWLVTIPTIDGHLKFLADSESLMSKGNIALLLRLFSDRTPLEILELDAREALDRLGLPQALVPQRANGLFAMVGRIRQEAMAMLAS